MTLADAGPAGQSGEVLPGLDRLVGRDDWLACLSRWYRSGAGLGPVEQGQNSLTGENLAELTRWLVASGAFEPRGGRLTPGRIGRELLYRANELLQLKRLEVSGELPSGWWSRADRGSVVEIGCGTGHCLLLLARLGFGPLHGYDLSPVAVAMASALLARDGFTALFHTKDATRLEAIPDSSVALVYSRIALYYFEVRGLARSVGRVLRPGGRLVGEVKAPRFYLACVKDLLRGRFRHAAAYARVLLRTGLYEASGRQLRLGGRSPELAWGRRTIRRFAGLAGLQLAALEYCPRLQGYRFELIKPSERTGHG